MIIDDVSGKVYILNDISTQHLYFWRTNLIYSTI